VRPNERTGNVLIHFDGALIDEQALLELLADHGAGRQLGRTPDAVPEDGRAAVVSSGWLRAQASGTIAATPAACLSALAEFQRYPEWQAFVTNVTVLESGRRGQGIRVATQARIGERDVRFTTCYRYPSPNRVVFEQEDGQLDAVRGSWTFRSIGGGRTRATLVLEVRPGWRLSFLLRGSLVDELGEAVVEHCMRELRARVEGV
jgi:ribosome-associated toxin RatA of RatAB toxin-antitoxin module